MLNREEILRELFDLLDVLNKSKMVASLLLMKMLETIEEDENLLLQIKSLTESFFVENEELIFELHCKKYSMLSDGEIFETVKFFRTDHGKKFSCIGTEIEHSKELEDRFANYLQEKLENIDG